jgi:hypothetical protein
LRPDHFRPHFRISRGFGVLYFRVFRSLFCHFYKS